MSSQSFIVIEKHSRILRIVHWLNVLFLFLMVWSGLLIYWAHQPYIHIPDNVGPFRIHHRLAEGMGWHFFIMWPFFINGLVYALYQLGSGEWRNLIPRKEDFRQAIPFLLFDLNLTKKNPHVVGKFNPLQKIFYTGIILSGLGSVITGLAIYKPVQFQELTFILGGYKAARFEHFILMIGYLLFFIMHVVQVLRAGWNNFRAMVAGYEIEK